MGAGFEVANLRLGLRLLLPHTHNTDDISDPGKHERIYTHERAGTCAVDTRRCPLIQFSFAMVQPGIASGRCSSHLPTSPL